MEANTVRTPQLRGELAPPLTTADRAKRNLWRPVDGALSEASDIGVFVLRTLRELGNVWRYASEVLRQAGILISGTLLVVIFMAAMMGIVCGTESNYVLRGYGATVYSGVFTSYCGREMIPYIFGYIWAAKVGTGLAAEIGAMRIQDEIDALESLGINPMCYVVATRLVAVWLVLPAFFILTAGTYYLFNYVILIDQIQEVSQGGWENVHWAFTRPLDLFYIFIRLSVFGTVIAMLGMFYGFRARGGPVGVGTATAKSMILNLILVHVLGAAMTSLFWGLKPNAPVGG
jgi:phospholipid/cholesterol/gamma-HCH transport system permease protein